jgi:hypothetical protein
LPQVLRTTVFLYCISTLVDVITNNIFFFISFNFSNFSNFSNFMNHEFALLQNHADIATLRPALHSLCSRFGSVARLDILAASQAGRRQALCFLRMDSAAQERELMSELGVGRFGGDLVVILDLQASSASRRPLAEALAA